MNASYGVCIGLVSRLSAGSVIIAIPTVVVFFLLQRQFVSGLALGATKG